MNGKASVFATAAGAAVAIASLCSSPSVQAKELIYNSYLPPQNALYKGAIAGFSKRLAKESGGKLTVNTPAASLGPQWKQWQLVTSGVADIAIVPNHSRRQALVMPNVANLAFLTKSAHSSSQALWNTQQKFFAPLDEYKGVKLIALCVLPGRELGTLKAPIKQLADLKGLKIWSGLTQKTQIEALGAVDVSVPFPKVYEVVSKGTVDGMIGSPSTILATRTGKFVKFLTKTDGGIGTAIFSVVMNASTFKSLSAAEKSQFERAAAGMSTVCGRAMDVGERIGARVITKKMGVTIYEPDPAVLGQIGEKLAFMKGRWLAAAKKRGLADPEQAYDFYVSEMTRIAAANAAAKPMKKP